MRQQGQTNFSIAASQAGLPSSVGTTIATDTSTNAVKAMVMSTDTLQTLNASQFTITAQKSQIVGGHKQWQTLPSGVAQCEDCATIRMPSVPKGTERFSVNVLLAVPAVEGVLRLASWNQGFF